MVVLLVAVLRPVALLLATRRVAPVTHPEAELLPVAVHPVAIHPAVAILRKGLPVAAILLPVGVRPVVAIHLPAVVPPAAAILRKVPRVAAILRKVALRAVAILRKVRPAAVTLRKVVLPVAATLRKVVPRAIRRLVAGPVTRRAPTRVRRLLPKNRTRCCS